MRRDLKRGCGTCRLRFSKRLTHCPVCHGTAMEVAEAVRSIEPTSRAAWLAKWTITLSLIPAFGLALSTNEHLLRETWPPANAPRLLFFFVVLIAGTFGACFAVALLFAVWLAFVTVIRFFLKLIIDRPQRALRVSIELQPRRSTTNAHPMHRLQDKLETFVNGQIEHPKPFLFIVASIFLVLEAIAEILGERPVLKTASWQEFGLTFIALVATNIGMAMLLAFFGAGFGLAVKWAYPFFDGPPHLFGFDPNPPDVQNDACLAKYRDNRDEIVGKAVPLEEVEKVALGIDDKSELKSPLSGQTCFAFRLVGSADEQPVDDADATSFVVIDRDKKRHVVRHANIVVNLPAHMKSATSHVRGFLRKRGLPERNHALQEGLLREGDRVCVVGRRSEFRVGTAGYRADDRRGLIDAGDGLPVVIQAPSDEGS